MRWFGWLRRRGTAEAPSRPLHIKGRATVAQGESHYVIPNDINEDNRLDLQHFILQTVFQKNYFAPLADPRRILDVACGTGRWAVEMARAFPQASVIGLDINAPAKQYQDAPGELPPNYTFQIGNVLEPLPFPENRFDFVHMRFMFSALPEKQWPVVVRELVRVTAPGGWVELVEATILEDGGPALARNMTWWQTLTAARGIDIMQGRHTADFLAAAGLTRIGTHSERLPVGGHGGKIGQLMGVDMLTVLRGAGPAFVQAGFATAEDYETNLKQTDADLYGGQYRCVLPAYVAYGQKPR